MFEKVIIAVNSRSGANDAIKLARELVSAHGTLTLVHVDIGYPLHARGVATLLPGDPLLSADHRLRAHRVLHDVSASSGIDSVLRSTATSVGRGLHELVERERADLLVMGSTRQGLIGQVLISNDTRDAINGAACAVAIAPGAYADAPVVIREVGVAYNETEEAERALTVGRGLAASHHAQLSVFEAVSPPLYADAATEALASVYRGLAEIEGVVPHATFGDAARELTIYSASVDLLIIGSRGFGPLGRLVHSHTSMRLARSARCPLLILTRAARVSASVGSPERRPEPTPAGTGGGA
jgi:nucleotide-binding universal stress UspA family protein